MTDMGGRQTGYVCIDHCESILSRKEEKNSKCSCSCCSAIFASLSALRHKYGDVFFDDFYREHQAPQGRAVGLPGRGPLQFATKTVVLGPEPYLRHGLLIPMRTVE